MTSEPDCRRLLTGALATSDVGQARPSARWRLPRASALTVALALAAAPLLAACGSGSAHPPPSASSAVSAACSQVAAALSDGPDPSADPVGYAEAQIRPLRAISTADPELRTAINGLATAYARVFESNGKNGAAARAVAADSRKVNAICPGTAS
jgi:hypothetical protein